MEAVPRRNVVRLVAAALLVVVGLARGLGGFAMVLAGREVLGGAAADVVIRIAGFIAFVLSGAAFVAGVFLIRSGRGRLYVFGAATVILLFLDGVCNGWLLFGAPRFGGQLANGAVGAIILTLLAVGRTRDMEAWTR